METPIPEPVARFLAVHVRTLEQLEILLLLASQPERAWSVDAVYDVIRSSRSSAAERLDELRLQGLLSVSEAGMYRYQPQVPEIAAVVETLAQLYKQRRVKIVELIYSQPTDPLQHFAEAFKFKKDK
jgi:hypothetical protein